MDLKNFQSLQEAYLDVYSEGLGGFKPQDDWDELNQKRRKIESEHIRKYKSGKLPFQKQKKADEAQEFLRKHPRKKRTQRDEQAYLDVYNELDEELTDGYDVYMGEEKRRPPISTMDYKIKQLNKKLKSSKVGSPEAKRTLKRLGNITGTRDTLALKIEQVDTYDLILFHLLDEGYAETPEAAEVMMVNMSEEWRESIMEGMTMKDFKENRKKLQRKEASANARKRGHVGKTWLDSGKTYTPDEAKSRRTKLTDARRQALYRIANDPDDDSPDDDHYPASKTNNPKKLRKQKAMGEHN